MQPDRSHGGSLVLAATPLGNIGDATGRLIEALASFDVVAAEDTRRTLDLAGRLGIRISGQLVSFYEHVEATRIPFLVQALRNGKSVLLVTDAGMPSVSDPGYRLVAAVIEAGLPVTCLPGASAVTTAIALSGLPVERFCFDGFAPRKQGERRRWLTEVATEPRAVVFFESPRRIASLLIDAVEVLGPDRRAAVCRELTKTYEEVARGSLAELAQWAQQKDVRGEITVVLAGASPVEHSLDDLLAVVASRVEKGERLKDACAAVATHDISKRDLYEAYLSSR